MCLNIPIGGVDEKKSGSSYLLNSFATSRQVLGGCFVLLILINSVDLDWHMCRNCSETKKTYPKTVAFETCGNNHARPLWHSRWKTFSVILFPSQTPHPHLQARRFRFVRTLLKTTVAHREKGDSGRSNVSSATLHWTCAKKKNLWREGRGQHTT